MTNNDNRWVEQDLSFAELAATIGIDDLETPELYEIEDQGYEILSVDPKTGKDVWKPIQNFIVKPGQDEHYNLDGLLGTGEHRVKFNNEWTKLSAHPAAVLVKKPMAVVDLTVKDTHTYKCGGQLNHNTTTPGGMSIPYSSSTRIRITSTGQKQIKNKEGDIIGIQVKAKTIKNKVANPFRTCEFQIHFGVGIVEHEETFDLFREAGTVKMDNGDEVSVSGVGAWKDFLVNDKNGEVIHSVKCYKAQFGTDVLEVPEYSKYVEALYEAALVVGANVKKHVTVEGVNEDSFEEMKALTK